MTPCIRCLIDTVYPYRLYNIAWQTIKMWCKLSGCVDLTTIQTSNWLCLSNGIVWLYHNLSTWMKWVRSRKFPGTMDDCVWYDMVWCGMVWYGMACVCNIWTQKGFQHESDLYLIVIFQKLKKTYWRRNLITLSYRYLNETFTYWWVRTNICF